MVLKKIKGVILAFLLINLFHSSLCADEFDEFSELENEFSVQEKANEVYDPFIGYNKVMHSFNMFIYEYVEYPVLVRYNGVVPNPIKKGISNFFYNLATPVRFLANLVALEPKKAFSELGYFMINTTWGIGGFIDVTKEHREKHNISKEMDIGAGLAHAGVGSGPYIVLPLLGPSNLRDALSLPISALANPISYIKPTKTSLSVTGFKSTNEYSQNIKEINMLYKGSLDSYILMRDYYEKHRKEISK